MCAALALRGLAPIVGDLVKERLTGAIILVALIVLLVPELLTGPIKSAPRAVVASAEEPPLRSYTINLGEDARAHSEAAQPQSAAPQALTAPANVSAPAPGKDTPAAAATTAAAPALSAVPAPATHSGSAGDALPGSSAARGGPRAALPSWCSSAASPVVPMRIAWRTS